MPMNPEEFGSRNASNAFVEASMSHLPPEEMSRSVEQLFAALSHIPAATAVAGWNSNRGANTILRGGWDPGKPGDGMFRSSFRAHNPFNPKTWTKLPDVGNIDPLGGSGDSKTYTPFNILAKYGNWGAKPSSGLGGKISKHLGGGGIINKLANTKNVDKANFTKRLMAAGIFSQTDIDNGTLFSPGMLSRVNTVGRLKRGKELTTTQSANLMKYLQNSDKAVANAIGSGKFGSFGTNMAAEALLMSGKGAISQGIGGYLAGSRFGFDLDNERMASALGKTSYIGGKRMAARHLALGGIEMVDGKFISKATGEVMTNRQILGGFKTAFKAGAATKTGQKAALWAGTKAASKFGFRIAATAASGPLAPIVGAAMTAWMVYDLAMMGISLIKALPGSISDAVTSLQGQIAKPIMGMGYRDTEVAATSRQRGVMAIQNSRLNARSILGNEASPMAAHFG
jgi:hypothetical protein